MHRLRSVSLLACQTVDEVANQPVNALTWLTLIASFFFLFFFQLYQPILNVWGNENFEIIIEEKC